MSKLEWNSATGPMPFTNDLSDSENAADDSFQRVMRNYLRGATPEELAMRWANFLHAIAQPITMGSSPPASINSVEASAPDLSTSASFGSINPLGFSASQSGTAPALVATGSDPNQATEFPTARDPGVELNEPQTLLGRIANRARENFRRAYDSPLGPGPETRARVAPLLEPSGTWIDPLTGPFRTFNKALILGIPEVLDAATRLPSTLWESLIDAGVEAGTSVGMNTGSAERLGRDLKAMPDALAGMLGPTITRRPQVARPDGRIELKTVRNREAAPARVSEPYGGSIARPDEVPSAPAIVSRDQQFDYSPAVMNKVPNVPQYDLKRYVPVQGIPQEIRGYFTPENANRRVSLVPKGIERGGLSLYNMTQLREQLIGELGRELGEEAFSKYVKYIGATTARSTSGVNARNASYYLWRDRQGIPAIVGEEPPYPYGHFAQNTHQIMADRVASGAGLDGVRYPKSSSFIENMLGNYQPVTIDTHIHKLFRNVGRDAPSLSMPLNGYGYSERQLQRMAEALALQLRFLPSSKSMGHHNSGDHGWQANRLRGRWSFGRRRCGM